MPGLNQIPAGAEGSAAFAFTYSGISFICSVVLCWLTIVHREGWSYVLLLGVSTGLSTIASMTQQIHVMIYYEDILREQFRRKVHFTESPELAIANGSFGLDLGLYYYQYWSYNVQALLVMFWACELAQSVYGLSNKPSARRWLAKVNIAGKAISFVFPAITILTLRSPALHDNFFAFILLADLPLMISLAIGSVLMILISVRYIRTKKGFTHWAPPSSSTNGGGTTSSVAGQTEFSSTQYGSSAGVPSKKSKSSRRPGFHDRWLLVRFFVSFFILAIFEVTNILFQLQSIANLENDSKLTAPDTSIGRANTTFFLFLPGTTAGIFLFIVFGTTAGCRAKMRELLIPQCWRDRRARKEAAGDDIEYNHNGTMFDGDDGMTSPGSGGKGRIVRSSSVTVTYTQSGNGDAVALENLAPSARQQQNQQHGRKKSFKSADDLLLESDRDSMDNDSTSEIMIGAAVPGSTPKSSNTNNNINNDMSRSRSNSSGSAYGNLNKPLPIPSDAPMARIAHFQSITRPSPARTKSGGGTTGSSAMPEVREEEDRRVMDRQFRDHQRRQPQQGQGQGQQQQATRKQWPTPTGQKGVVSTQPVLGEEYYGSSPEQSDDSGPVLPIMPGGKRT
ncbi:hypothetical protein Micbo1qcDRAFT_167787 [Microdochium bolleyi]|uniref:Uncharacterized protein n=1 Tax=Microdochium bolleyi TaxID=196109 RepID=A0A136IQ66_9PEZI|nr:hypothetical protein Micbo1qcDRAFT_167787 [Microdochium bolleyi]